MDRNQVSEDSLTVTELKGGFGGGQQAPVHDDGTYEAEYQKLKVFMDNTPWGEKKCARIYFKITKGKYKDQPTSYKGTFFFDENANAWVVGGKSKLADAIRALTGGKTLSPDHVGTRVFVVVKQKVSKKTGNPYSFVETIIPRPDDEGETLTEAAASAQAPAPRPVQARPAPVQARPAAAPVQARPVAKPVIPAQTEDTGGGLLADLTELSDFKE